jgi:hypothetical protein
VGKLNRCQRVSIKPNAEIDLYTSFAQFICDYVNPRPIIPEIANFVHTDAKKPNRLLNRNDPNTKEKPRIPGSKKELPGRANPTLAQILAAGILGFTRGELVAALKTSAGKWTLVRVNGSIVFLPAGLKGLNERISDAVEARKAITDKAVQTAMRERAREKARPLSTRSSPPSFRPLNPKFGKAKPK